LLIVAVGVELDRDHPFSALFDGVAPKKSLLARSLALPLRKSCEDFLDPYRAEYPVVLEIN
jgi:hypothetical protein